MAHVPRLPAHRRGRPDPRAPPAAPWSLPAFRNSTPKSSALAYCLRDGHRRLSTGRARGDHRSKRLVPFHLSSWTSPVNDGSRIKSVLPVGRSPHQQRARTTRQLSRLAPSADQPVPRGPPTSRQPRALQPAGRSRRQERNPPGGEWTKHGRVGRAHGSAGSSTVPSPRARTAACRPTPR